MDKSVHISVLKNLLDMEAQKTFYSVDYVQFTPPPLSGRVCKRRSYVPLAGVCFYEAI
jgi:hypothetical protein